MLPVNRSLLANLSLLLVAMMWGSTFLIVQNAIAVLPPLAFNGIRFVGAAILLAFILTFIYPDTWKQLSWAMVGHASILGVFLFVGYSFQTIGLLYTTTSNAGFITGMSVVLVPFLSFLLLKHPLTKYIWISAGLALAGLFLLTFAGSSFNFNKGDMFILLCAVGFALQIVFTAIYAPKYPALILTTIQLAIVGILSVFSSFIFEDVGSISQFGHTIMQPKVFFALLISIGPTSALAFWIQIVCQKFTSPTRVSIIYATEPVFAAITGAIFGGEVLGISAIIGCVCILSGMLLAELKSTAST
ncbi:DMT family transporter [Paenibacillus sp. CMAA1364]